MLDHAGEGTSEVIEPTFDDVLWTLLFVTSLGNLGCAAVRCSVSSP